MVCETRRLIYKGRDMKVLNIGKEFSEVPSGRYRTDGDVSGEAFREDVLKEKILALKEDEKLQIILDDGVEGYGSSFLVEGFAGLVKHGYIEGPALLSKIDFVCSDEDFEFYKNKIVQYIHEAKFNSKKYVPSK